MYVSGISREFILQIFSINLVDTLNFDNFLGCNIRYMYLGIYPKGNDAALTHPVAM